MDMEGILCGSPEIQNALHPETGYIIIWPKLPDNLVSQSFCTAGALGCKNGPAGEDEGKVRTGRLFSDEEISIRHLPVDGGSPELFAPS